MLDSVSEKKEFSVKVFKQQLIREVFPTYITNNERRKHIKEVVRNIKDSKSFIEHLRKWINNFTLEFSFEIDSKTKK